MDRNADVHIDSRSSSFWVAALVASASHLWTAVAVSSGSGSFNPHLRMTVEVWDCSYLLISSSQDSQDSFLSYHPTLYFPVYQ